MDIVVPGTQEGTQAQGRKRRRVGRPSIFDLLDTPPQGSQDIRQSFQSIEQQLTSSTQ